MQKVLQQLSGRGGHLDAPSGRRGAHPEDHGALRAESDATSMSQIVLNAKLAQLKAANTLFAETSSNMMFQTKMSLGGPVPSTSTSRATPKQCWRRTLLPGSPYGAGGSCRVGGGRMKPPTSPLRSRAGFPKIGVASWRRGPMGPRSREHRRLTDAGEWRLSLALTGATCPVAPQRDRAYLNIRSPLPSH